MTLAMVLGPIAGGYLSNHQFGHGFTLTTPYWVGLGLVILNLILLALFFYTPAVNTPISKPTILDSTQQLFAIISHGPMKWLLLILFFLELAWSQYYQVIFLYRSCDEKPSYPF